MIVGIDFDNTIACYDHLFYHLGMERGLIPEGFPRSKQQIRDHIRQLPQGEREWQMLQSLAYGREIHRAEIYPHFQSFVRSLRKQDIPLYIVSHKTEYAPFDSEHIPLRECAVQWMHFQGFFDARDLRFQETDIYFESTRQEKIKRIQALHCTHFIDDLIETFEEPGFPASVMKILLSRKPVDDPHRDIYYFGDWRGIQDFFVRTHFADFPGNPTADPAVSKTGVG